MSGTQQFVLWLIGLFLMTACVIAYIERNKPQR